MITCNRMFKFKPCGICAKEISFKIEDGKLRAVSFTSGCNGNLTALSRLVEGMDTENAIRILQGINCSGRGTSCADQLCEAIKAYQA